MEEEDPTRDMEAWSEVNKGGGGRRVVDVCIMEEGPMCVSCCQEEEEEDGRDLCESLFVREETFALPPPLRSLLIGDTLAGGNYARPINNEGTPLT